MPFSETGSTIGCCPSRTIRSPNAGSSSSSGSSRRRRFVVVSHRSASSPISSRDNIVAVRCCRLPAHDSLKLVPGAYR